MVNDRVVCGVGVGIAVGAAVRVGGWVLKPGDGRGSTSGVMLGVDGANGGGARKLPMASLNGR